MLSAGINADTLLRSINSRYNYTASGKSGSRENLNDFAKSGLSVSLTAKSVSQTSLALEFTSDGGDKVSLSYQAIEYSESTIELRAVTDSEKIKEIAAFIKDEFESMKKMSYKSIYGTDETTTVEAASKLPPDSAEYWNAENTSTRIFNFAHSFYGSVGVAGEEFLNKIKSAIDDGFKMAKEILGELPQKTAELVQNTYDLVSKKLDSWAQQTGIISEDSTVT